MCNNLGLWRRVDESNAWACTHQQFSRLIVPMDGTLPGGGCGTRTRETRNALPVSSRLL